MQTPPLQDWPAWHPASSEHVVNELERQRPAIQFSLVPQSAESRQVEASDEGRHSPAIHRSSLEHWLSAVHPIIVSGRHEPSVQLSSAWH